MKTKIFLTCLLGSVCLSQPNARPEQETQYLVFQVWPAQPGYPGIPPLPCRHSLSREQMAGFAQGLIKAIGTTGDARHKLGFAVGPFSFDVPDDETRQWIRDAFAVARENDVAVAIHIDDSMSWGQRKDLLSNPDNIETADWHQVPNAARSLHWGHTPTKFPPQMCYNAPEIVAAAKARAGLIGAELKRELEVLKAQGKEHLFAAVIAGSETQIGEEFGTSRPLGFRALAHRGFSEKHPPKDLDAERASVVQEWIELWCNALHAAGTPREKIFCHLALAQGLRADIAKESRAERAHFAPIEMAFNAAFHPGFSTYPEGQTFEEIYAVLVAHGSPGWMSAEGTNVSPGGMPGEPTMETYLGRMFNHGGVLVNVFSWGIGGEAQRNNFFRRATGNPECLAAYAKFLRGEQLVESQGFSGPGFQRKMRRIQAELPSWIQKTGRQAEAMPLMHTVKALIKEKKWQEADKAADEVLALMKSDSQAEAKISLPLSERLPPKIHRIQQELPGWLEKADADKKDKATALMQKLKEYLEAKNFEDVEKVADEILKLLPAK
jgi:dihydroneopterin aldolase